MTLAEARKHPDYVAEYKMRDAEGRTAAVKVRLADRTRGKRMLWFGVVRPDGVHEGLPPSAKRYLYRLPEVVQAIRAGDPVWLHEGEKAADAAHAAGWPGVHTCTMEGGVIGEWVAEQLRGSELVVVVDRDETGERMARSAAERLRGVASSCRFVQAPAQCGDKADAYDAIVAGIGPDGLDPRPDLDAEMVHPAVKALRTSGADEVYDVEYDYLWDPWLIKGKLHLLEADGNVGKTSLALAIAASLSRGVVPSTTMHCEPASTLFVGTGEDTDEEIRTVYGRMGGRQDRLAIYQDRLSLTEAGVQAIGELRKAARADFVYLDGLFDFLGDDVNSATSVAKAMGAFARAAARWGVPVLIARHQRKGKTDVGPTDRGVGSVMFRNKARGQMILFWHPTRKGAVVLYEGRGSLLRQKPLPLVFRRTGQGIEWIHVSDEERAQLDEWCSGRAKFPGAQAPSEPAGADPGGRPSSQGAELCLAEQLREHPHGLSIEEMLEKLQGEGHAVAKRTLWRMIDRMGLKSRGRGVYQLPDPFSD